MGGRWAFKDADEDGGCDVQPCDVNSSGHPGLSLPVGFVRAKDDASVWLPTGLQIVGRKFEDLTCLKVLGSWEKRHDWKRVRFGPKS